MTLARKELARTGFKPSRKVTLKSRTPMKSKGPRMTPIRKSAKGEDCTVRVPGVCNRDPATTVWAHSNSHKDGKGMGLKARDEEGCYACFACHSWLDGGYASNAPREVRDKYFDLARAESQSILKRKGLME